MPEQLVFDLPHRTARGREDFFISPSNALAVVQVEDWKNWPQRKLLLIGPEGAGKSHLAQVWADQTGASAIDAAGLAEIDIATAAEQGAVIVEDANRVAGSDAAQAALFHLHNLVQANGGLLLMTARGAPKTWGLSLADLQSRIEATPVATLAVPDDSLLAALLVKQFSDRQIAVPPKVVSYLVRRMERSFGAAQVLVAELDRLALSRGRRITLQMAAEVLDNPPR